MNNSINNTINNKEKGNKGESIACYYLEKRGYSVINRNFQRKWGELDIIATKDNILHFIEVKSTYISNNRPEENVHELKLRKLRKTIQLFLYENKYDNDLPFMFHIIVVKIDTIKNKYYVKMLENIIL